jgi:hypothetical protein
VVYNSFFLIVVKYVFLVPLLRGGVFVCVVAGVCFADLHSVQTHPYYRSFLARALSEGIFSCTLHLLTPTALRWSTLSSPAAERG